MAHECLMMADRPGPPLVVFNTAVMQVVWPDHSVLLPAGSIYVGRTLRFVASGVVGFGFPGQILRMNVGNATSPPVVTGAIITGMWAQINALTGRTPNSQSSWRFDMTMTCRAVGAALTDWMGYGIFHSSALVGSVVGRNDAVINPVFITAPVVSQTKISNLVDQWLALYASVSVTGACGMQVQNYRVDSIA